MRRLGFLILLCMCATTVFSYNESVAAISFNPSRLGAYTYLKAVSNATLAGGLDTQTNNVEMNIKSKGTVTLQDQNADAHKCTKGSCTGHNFATGVSGNLNSIKVMEPKAVAAGQTIATKANMTKAVLKKPTNNPASNSYSITDRDQDQPTAAQGTSFTLYGGTLKATKESYIHAFIPNDSLKKLEIAATNLIAQQGFHVKGNFTLGKIEVQPSSCTNGCKSYHFIERLNTSDSKKYKVLAVKVK